LHTGSVTLATEVLFKVSTFVVVVVGGDDVLLLLLLPPLLQKSEFIVSILCESPSLLLLLLPLSLVLHPDGSHRNEGSLQFSLVQSGILVVTSFLKSRAGADSFALSTSDF
jgi:hypothetical protein